MDGIKFSPSSPQHHAKKLFQVKLNDLSAKGPTNIPQLLRKFHELIFSISESFPFVSLILKTDDNKIESFEGLQFINMPLLECLDLRKTF